MANEKRLIDANVLRDAILFVRGLLSTKGAAEWTKGCRCGLGAVLEQIRELPTVDAVEVIHAKWENVQKGKGCCSNCHRLDSVDSLATHCRYCGAKMDGDGNGNL